MKNDTLSAQYETFCRMMYEDKIYLLQGVTFREICNKYGFDERELNKMLVSELGVGGDALIGKFCSDYDESIAVKYFNKT